MIAGTIAVRAELGDASASVKDRDIHDALWNYYWDVQQTVELLRNTVLKKESKAGKKKKKGAWDFVCFENFERRSAGFGRPGLGLGLGGGL